MFKKALGLEEVGINENFFELGGNSLKAASVLMAAMVRKIPVIYQDIFDAPTVRDLETLILKKDGKEPEQPEHPEQEAVSEIGVLSHNRNEYVDEIERGSLGDVLLTGTTGFLGSHVLQELIDHTDAKVYCLVRSGKLTAKQRLSSILYYYFDRSFEDEFDRRIFIIEGDIDDIECLDRTLDLNYSTVINCAACVKHFADMEFLKRINLHGVENLTQLCLKKGVRLIQISTVSVGGFAVGESARGQVFSEDCLDIGQDVKYNAYVYTKYLAEKHVLKAIEEDGLDAKIIRVGSLSGRVRDGEFQMNFRTNAFMNSLRAYAVLGAYPCNALSETVEFSFVDETARAVVLLSGTGRDFTVFHAYNAHTVEMGDIIQTLNDCGIAVENVSYEEFDRRLREGLTREDINSYLSTLVGYDLDDDADRVEIPPNNRFTVNALYRLGMRWTISDLSVIKRMIRSLKTLGFFDCT
jgi:thioester reductase-like protein